MAYSILNGYSNIYGKSIFVAIILRNDTILGAILWTYISKSSHKTNNILQFWRSDENKFTLYISIGNKINKSHTEVFYQSNYTGHVLQLHEGTINFQPNYEHLLHLW